MAAVAPPRPSYKPQLPPRLLATGILSDAQLESVIYAGEAHASHLAGSYTVDDTYDLVTAAPEPAPAQAGDAVHAVRFRRGWFLGDGTGAGKGRQVAAIILDNWLKGRRRALWISKSDKLIEDAERDWTAIGGYRSDIVSVARFRQGAPVTLAEGILFTTYATLRTQAKADKPSRVQQIIDWLGRGFDGVIVFDEAHAMANAAGDKGERGKKSRRSRARPVCACSMRCMTHECSMSRRPAPPPFRTSPMPRASVSGAREIFRSRPAPILSRPWKKAASPPWKCWRAISRRSAFTRHAHCRLRASNTKSSSIGSRGSRSASMTPTPMRSRSSTAISMRR
jgi:hypothetical protein